MWTVGCSNGGEINTTTTAAINNNTSNTDDISDSSSQLNRRFKPLMPKKAFSAMSFASSHRPYSPNDLLALNHHFAAERYKKEMAVQQQILMASSTSRWNPTPEQLQALEDIYRRGTRTPSSEQIQQIASQLRRFGKIEGKNVFYWFQNHKARERQKRRRVLDPGSGNDRQGTDGSFSKPEPGARRTPYEVDQTKNWTLPSNCSTLSEETESIHRAAVGAESKSENCLINQFEGREKYQTVQKHDTCHHMMKLKTTIDKNVLSRREFFCRIYNEDYDDQDDQCCDGRSRTLELFPIRSDDDYNYVREVDYSVSNATSPIKFFEFLPLKS